MKNILLTFDYELFLGARSGTIEKCLIQPTDHLDSILQKHGATAVMFVDTTCLNRIKQQPGLHDQYEKIKKQLLRLHENGHYIYPHIHPHWLDAKYLGNGEFDLSDLSKYSLAGLNEKQIHTLFLESIGVLNEIGISYQEWGYRAGGWCMQPFNKFEKIFREFNIWYEFSVLPGFKNDSSEQRFDYTLVTKKNPYSFSTEVETENTSGDFTEFPISTIHVTKGVGLVSTFINKILWKTGDRGYGNGLSARTASLKFTSPQQEMISIDILNAAKSSVYKKFLKNNNYMHWISHPKMFTNHGLKKFDAFLNHANQSYQVEYNFKKMHIKSKTI